MGLKQYLISFSLMSGLCLLFFYVSQKQITSPWIQLALNPEISDIFVQSMKNQKELAHLDPDNKDEYREQFDQTQELLAHMEVLQTSRQSIIRRYEIVLLALFGASLLLLFSIQYLHYRRLDHRLLRLRKSLEKLAAGEDVAPEKIRRDIVGKIQKMIEYTSRVMGKRLKHLENLEHWQESSRRMAHEIRTPLTAIQLELKKLMKVYHQHISMREPAIQQFEESIFEELSRLSDFTDQFTAFAKIRKPVLKTENLSVFIREFVELYEEAWPNLGLVLNQPETVEWDVKMDRRMIRQVLVNLCNNSSNAMDESEGSVTFTLEAKDDQVVLDVTDTGPGIPSVLRHRLFEPYTTTKPVGDGMGLGLAISKKIMLDHQGDLELSRTSSEGAEFQLSFSRASSEHRSEN